MKAVTIATSTDRPEPVSETKAITTYWLVTGGIDVNAEELQFKETDGQEDGLNEERRTEDDDREFDPLKVPPIAVWQAYDGQVYVVDGHKRLAQAKKRGVPAIRAFFIAAKSFKEAKKKGERLNERLNKRELEVTFVKAKDAKGHLHAEKGTSEGGRFVSQGGGGGAPTKGKKKPANGKAKPQGGVAKVEKVDGVEDTDVGFPPPEGKEYNSIKIVQQARVSHAKEMDVKGWPVGSDKGQRQPITKKGAYVSRKEWETLKQKALNKVMTIAMHKDKKPTKQEIKENQDKIKEKQRLMDKGIITEPGSAANWARKDLVGNSTQRRERKVVLATEFGDGKRCGCVHCGQVISFSPKYAKKPMDEDKIHVTAKGGKYKVHNLIPACGPCNRNRADADIMTTLKNSGYGRSPFPKKEKDET